jgi:hypothetical protein
MALNKRAKQIMAKIFFCDESIINKIFYSVHQEIISV